MSSPEPARTAEPTPGRDERGRGKAAWGGLVAGVVVVAAAAVVPNAVGVDVRVGTAVPLLADWDWRSGPASLVALLVVVALVWPGIAATAGRMPWGRLLLLSWAVASGWMVALAMVDGPAGLGQVLDGDTEYLRSAQQVDDVGDLLRTYIDRIPLDAPDNWPVHLAGHPPGAVLFFVALDRVGLGSWQAAGLVVIAVAATIPAAVAVTLDRLGARPAARAALPFLVVGPSAIWMAVSADAVFAATAAWAVAALAGAVGTSGAARPTSASGMTSTASTPHPDILTGPRRWSSRGAAVVSGLLFGWCLLLSYGMVLLGLVALAVLTAARRPVRERIRLGAGVAAVALGVVGAFAVAGFAWWEAYPVLEDRYWDGLAKERPGWYWVGGNLAALVLCAGPLLPAALGSGLLEVSRLVSGRAAAARDLAAARLSALLPGRAPGPVAALVVAALGTVLVADLSLMSKAEVERIWLPFVPWLLLSVVWLPPAWRRWGLVGQACAAVLVQHVVRTAW
ncbi:MAG: hypothetical protein ACRCXL_16825 [Dermatophilaceae bacterium]